MDWGLARVGIGGPSVTVVLALLGALALAALVYLALLPVAQALTSVSS